MDASSSVALVSIPLQIGAKRWYAGAMAYCQRCRIGTLDKDGLCVLCGASAKPETPVGRLAELGSALASRLLSPFTIGGLVFLALAASVASVTGYGAQAPAFARRPPSLMPGSPAALAQSDPAALMFGLFAPALFQTLLLVIIVVVVLLLMRRTRNRRDAAKSY